ncbi:small multi-drug export protein [Patescibacteria group bacterium]|nr:small multi-drug export protein [Patescibacteria group bacterium]
MNFLEYIKTLPPEIVTYLLAMAPIGELRTSIPFAMTVLKMSTWGAFFFSLAGTVTITIILYFLLDPVTIFLRSRSKTMDQFFEWLFHRTRTKHSKKMHELGLIALLVFVAIPLPGSGVWTGTLIAYLFNVKSSHGIPIIALGATMTAVFITFGTDFLLFLFR